MDLGWADLVTAIPGAIVGLGGAWLGLKGRREEASVQFNGDLLERQAKRIERLETRQTALETKLDDTLALLRLEQDRTHQLRRALEDAIGWLMDFLDWSKSDRAGQPPEPDVRELSSVLRESYALPTARNPPESTE